MSLNLKFRALVDNLISRLFGAVVRSVTLVIGCLVWLFVLVSSVFIWTAWMLLPFIIVILAGLGIRAIIGGVV